MSRRASTSLDLGGVRTPGARAPGQSRARSNMVMALDCVSRPSCRSRWYSICVHRLDLGGEGVAALGRGRDGRRHGRGGALEAGHTRVGRHGNAGDAAPAVALAAPPHSDPGPCHGRARLRGLWQATRNFAELLLSSPGSRLLSTCRKIAAAGPCPSTGTPPCRRHKRGSSQHALVVFLDVNGPKDLGGLLLHPVRAFVDLGRDGAGGVGLPAAKLQPGLLEDRLALDHAVRRTDRGRRDRSRDRHRSGCRRWPYARRRGPASSRPSWYRWSRSRGRMPRRPHGPRSVGPHTGPPLPAKRSACRLRRRLCRNAWRRRPTGP